MIGSKKSRKFRPLNIAVASGSRAEQVLRARAGLPGDRHIESGALAPGLHATPGEDLVYHGGKTIRNLVFTNFYVGGSHAWKQADVHHIDQALASAMADRNLNNVLIQYFHNKPITSRFVPSRTLPGTKPAVFSQGDVEGLVQHLFDQGQLSGFDLGSTVFDFMLPHGTILTTDEAPSQGHAGTVVEALGRAATGGRVAAQGSRRHNPAHPEDEVSSIEGLGGYHGSVHVDKSKTVYYAVGVYSQRLPDGTENGIVAFDKPWKNVVATFYHELCEARTDADVEDAIRAGDDPKAIRFLGWISRHGDECGDFPMSEAGSQLELVMKEVPLADGSGTVPVQLQYSNAVHGPEGPIATPHVVRHAGAGGSRVA